MSAPLDDAELIRQAGRWAARLVRAYGTPTYEAEFRKTLEQVVFAGRNLEDVPDRFNALLHVLVTATVTANQRPGIPSS